MLTLLPGSVSATGSIKIVINIKVNKLAFIKDGEVLKTFPVATGKKPGLTPLGKWKVVRKVVNPYYNKLKIPGGSPRNPLGVRWLGLNALGTSGGTYGIHGTNNPSSIGKYVSAGCIRMYNKDVIWLYDNTPVYTPVEIINENWNLEQRPINIVINGNKLPMKSESKAYMVDNRVMVPCRSIAEAMKYSVSWNGKDQTVNFSNGLSSIRARVGSKNIVVDGVTRAMDVPTVLKNGRVFLHVRALAEAFGCQEITWDWKSQTVYLKK